MLRAHEGTWQLASLDAGKTSSIYLTSLSEVAFIPLNAGGGVFIFL